MDILQIESNYLLVSSVRVVRKEQGESRNEASSSLGVIERRRREDRGAEGVGRGCPRP